MSNDILKLLSGDILEETVNFTLADLCRASGLSAEDIIEMVDFGVVEPLGTQPINWRFHGVSVKRVKCAHRLVRDLGVNTAGAALAIDLLEELERMHARLSRLEAELSRN